MQNTLIITANAQSQLIRAPVKKKSPLAVFKTSKQSRITTRPNCRVNTGGLVETSFYRLVSKPYDDVNEEFSILGNVVCSQSHTKRYTSI